MKYECEGQLSLFESIPMTDDVKNIDNYAEEVVMHGTGFVNGKKRVYELYQRDMTPSEREKAIKAEYGIGGGAWPLKGYGACGYSTCSTGEMKIEYKDKDGEHEGVISWNRIETIIHRLVEMGRYVA